ncbi:MAG: DUF1648 domain-containing protein [Imperialibacter sp.]|uniref:DUF1648 domain-containing protein n=1 Tax=Imperialibacter sp. TaxID=2038411 RepID=UPI0032EAC1CF
MNINGLNKILHLLSIPLVAFLILYPSWMYGELPERIPVHFNLAGEADRWGGKGHLFVLPGIGIGLYLLLLFLAKSGWLEQQSEDNATHLPPSMVGYMKLYLLWSSLTTLALFATISFQSINVALGVSDTLAASDLPAYLTAVLLPLPFIIYKNNRDIKRYKTLAPNKD